MKMRIKAILLVSAAISAAACSSATNENAANTAANTTANTAVVGGANPNNNPTLNVTPQPAASSAIPGIPNAPANSQINKEDPTRNAKIQPMPGAPAPDNSEIVTSLGTNLVKTRTFKNNPQIAKIEQTFDAANPQKSISVKVFLRNGQARELSTDKVKDPMTELAANILKSLGGEAPKETVKDAPKAETKIAPKP